MELAEMLMQDMEKFKKQHGIDRLVMCWCGSTEVYQEDMNHEAFNTIDGFEKALKNNLAIIPPSMIYALFLDMASRAGMRGIQEWLSFYFKSPQCRPDLKPVNSLFDQDEKMRNTLRILMGEKVIDHSGLDYYEPKG